MFTIPIGYPNLTPICDVLECEKELKESVIAMSNAPCPKV